MTCRQREILGLLGDGWRTSQELAEMLGGRNKAGLTRSLRNLAWQGVIESERVSPDPYGEFRYRLARHGTAS